MMMLMMIPNDDVDDDDFIEEMDWMGKVRPI